MACRSGCPTPGAHRSFGECARAANIRIGQVDATAEKRWSAEINAYRSAREQGGQDLMYDDDDLEGWAVRCHHHDPAAT